MVLWDDIQISIKPRDLDGRNILGTTNRVLTDCGLDLFILYWIRCANSGIAMETSRKTKTICPKGLQGHVSFQ